MSEEARENGSDQKPIYPPTVLRAWLSQTQPIDLFVKLRERVFGQDEALRKAAILMYGYVSNLPDGYVYPKFHFLIEGSSGCGKTTFAQALKNILPMPVIIADASQITSSGYKGAEVCDLISSDELDQWYGCGVLILDELDKLMEPSYDGRGQNFHLEALNNLLKLMDGGTLIDRQGNSVDCSRLLVIGMGAFSNLKQKRKETRPIGFGMEAFPAKEASAKTEIADFCGSEQLLGRFNSIIHFRKPDRRVYEKILFQTLAELQRIYGRFQFPYEKVCEILDNAPSENFGCRGIKSAVWEAFLNMDSVISQSQIRAATYKQNELDYLDSISDDDRYCDPCA